MMEPNDENKSKLLMRALEFFSPFSDEELDSISELSEMKRYGIHKYIIKENAEGDFFYVIIKGKLNVIHEGKKDSRRTIASLNAGDCFGEVALILDQPRSASILAASECYLFKIDGRNIDSLNIEIREKLFRQFAIFLARRLIRTSIK